MSHLLTEAAVSSHLAVPVINQSNHDTNNFTHFLFFSDTNFVFFVWKEFGALRCRRNVHCVVLISHLTRSNKDLNLYLKNQANLNLSGSILVSSLNCWVYACWSKSVLVNDWLIRICWKVQYETEYWTSKISGLTLLIHFRQGQRLVAVRRQNIAGYWRCFPESREEDFRDLYRGIHVHRRLR